MIFVDSSAWCAGFVRTDADYARAAAWLRGNDRPLVTTDYVVDETLTAVRVRGHVERSIRVGEKLFDAVFVTLEWVTPEDIRKAWDVFRKFRDKNWSFTDCTSRVVMERLGVHRAFAFDEHFRQFGTVTVVP